MANRTPERRVSLFEGEPHTVYGQDGLHRQVFDVRIRELTPENAKRAEALTAVILIFAIIGVLIMALEEPLLFILGVPVVLISGTAIQKSLYQSLRIETRVIFTPTDFKVLRRGRWDVYDRLLKHSFVMLKHDEARREREELESCTRAAQAQGRFRAPRRYYDDAYHMVFEYFGQRHDIATVFDEKRARAVIARLQACDLMMDSQIKMGEGHVLSPEEEWSKQPGGLPGHRS
ncbi:hypothetical protein KG088_17860 [Halomonas sp. TRM85114]|uniref:hypothetical protein n=1 Tax=Halomonas jincaotanensis TaxID=2810616 RepID=UPI001BD3FA9A|nr:hypothetical protein [Halomonas jincaotanensis]MBS9405473.1 hypothetical protein [Halomonas jincaotanensis]